MQFGGEDRELGERLKNNGIKGKQIRHRAICLHLDHKKNYITIEGLKKNNTIRSFTKRNKVTFSPYGIDINSN